MASSCASKKLHDLKGILQPQNQVPHFFQDLRDHILYLPSRGLVQANLDTVASDFVLHSHMHACRLLDSYVFQRRPKSQNPPLPPNKRTSKLHGHG